MATSTVNTNKPIIPRGVDDRPVDKYNRAELYSGKALDFDGVNDYVDGGTLDITGYTQMSMSFYFKAHSTTNDWRLISIRYSGSDDIRIFHATSIGAGKLSFALDDGTAVTFSEDFTTNEWYHVVMTHDGTTLKAYFNGVLVQSAASDFNYSGTNGLFYIGRYTGGTFSYYDGEFSNFKLFNTALTAAQVADLYNNPEKVVPTGVSDSALKLWLPMMEGAGTTAINGAPDAIGSELVTNGDFSDGSNDWTFGSAFSVVNGKAYYNDSAAGNQIYQSNLTFDTSKNYLLTFDISDATDAVLWVGNSAGTNAYTISSNYNTYNNGNYYLLLRGSDIGASETTLAFWANPSGAAFSIDNISLKEVANCGTISGATWTHGIGAPVAQTSVIDWNKRKLEGESTTNEYLIPQGLTSGRDLLGNLFENVRKQGALNLDGNSWAEVHDNESLDFGTGSFTLEAWVKAKYINQGSVFNMIISLGGNITSSNNAGLMLLNNNVPYFIYSNPGASSGSAQTEGDWIHLVGTYDETNTTLYVNGVQVDQDARTASDITNGFAKLIGRDGTDPNRYYNDQIAQPRIYNRALTASEVLNNYNATSSLYI